jgi:hypothetical protein
MKKSLDSKKSYQEAQLACGYASRNKTEAQNYKNDAFLTSLVVDFYKYKLQALKYKTLFENKRDVKSNQQRFLSSLKSSVDIFRQLTLITSTTYESLSDVPAKHPEKLKKCPYHWLDILPIYKREYEIYENEGKVTLDSSFYEPSIEGLAGIWYSDPGLKYPDSSYATTQIDFDWSKMTVDFGHNWSARWFGFIVTHDSNTVVMECEADRGATIKSGDNVLISWTREKTKKSIRLYLQKNVPFPIEIIYDHDGGDTGYLKIRWLQFDREETEQASVQLFHSPAQKQQMDRITLLN